MKSLLDTHILLWWLTDDRRLSSKAKELIANPNNCVYVSAASMWEIAIKRALGRITIEFHDLEEAIKRNGFEQLAISFRHAAGISALPNYHRDPFDRMLIAQCIAEDARLLTNDSVMRSYGRMVMVI